VGSLRSSGGGAAASCNSATGAVDAGSGTPLAADGRQASLMQPLLPTASPDGTSGASDGSLGVGSMRSSGGNAAAACKSATCAIGVGSAGAPLAGDGWQASAEVPAPATPCITVASATRGEATEEELPTEVDNAAEAAHTVGGSSPPSAPFIVASSIDRRSNGPGVRIPVGVTGIHRWRCCRWVDAATGDAGALRVGATPPDRLRRIGRLRGVDGGAAASVAGKAAAPPDLLFRNLERELRLLSNFSASLRLPGCSGTTLHVCQYASTSAVVMPF